MILETRQVLSPTGTWVEVREMKTPELSYRRVRWNMQQSPLHNHFKAVREYLYRAHGIRLAKDTPPTAFHFIRKTRNGITWLIHEPHLQSYTYKKGESHGTDTSNGTTANNGTDPQ